MPLSSPADNAADRKAERKVKHKHRPNRTQITKRWWMFYFRVDVCIVKKLFFINILLFFFAYKLGWFSNQCVFVSQVGVVGGWWGGAGRGTGRGWGWGGWVFESEWRRFVYVLLCVGIDRSLSHAVSPSDITCMESCPNLCSSSQYFRSGNLPKI